MRAKFDLSIFLIPKLYCFIVSLLATSYEFYNLIRDEIMYHAIFVNYTIILKFILAIYGVVISIYFKSKSNTISQLIWWIPQIIIINKVIYTIQSVAKNDTVFDLSLLFRFGFSSGYKGEYDVYTMVQINIIAAIGIILVLIEREKLSKVANSEFEVRQKEN